MKILGFEKRQREAPFLYMVGSNLGAIVDGITGLLMLPFNRYGTDFEGIMAGKILEWRSKRYFQGKL